MEPETQTNDPAPRASVIVCVYNRPGPIRTCLDSVLASDADDFEVVVVDDGSTDETPEVLADYIRTHPNRAIRVVRNERNLGVSGARNAGVREARGAFVLFTDSDCTVSPDWLSLLVAAMVQTGAAAGSGTVIDVPPRTLAEHAACGTTRIGLVSWQRRSLVGGNMIVRRELALAHPFDESLVYGCDEDELAWRLRQQGRNLCFVPEAAVHHDHPMTVRSYLRQGWAQGIGSARYWYKRGLFIGRDLWFLSAAVVSAPLCLWQPRLWPVPLGFFLMQVLALLLNEVLLKGKRWTTALMVLPLVTLHSVVKACSVYVTLLKMLVGADRSVRAVRTPQPPCEQ